MDELHSILVGGSTPLKKYESKWESSTNGGGENKHIFELPPPTFSL